jgi:LacI family transcriptional regulator
MKYRPNVVSRSLRTGTTQTIGFISDTVATTPFAGHLIWGALDGARERDHLLLIAETEGDIDLERQQIDAMLDRRVDGIIFASMYTRRLTVPEALLDTPSVLLNALPAEPVIMPAVVPDEIGAGRTAAEVLLSAGHAEGIFLIGAEPTRERAPGDSLAAIERLRGVKDALRAAGAQLAGGVFCSQWQPTEGYEATRRLLKRHGKPEALICFNDRLSVGAYHALQDAGVKVPDEVSVVSFDDEPVASWLRPELTSIALPHYQLGRTAVEVLLDRGTKGPDGRGQIHRVPMPLRERASVRH